LALNRDFTNNASAPGRPATPVAQTQPQGSESGTNTLLGIVIVAKENRPQNPTREEHTKDFCACRPISAFRKALFEPE
jgi:hypothetical protein